MLWTIFFVVNVLLLLGRLRELPAQQQVTLNRIARTLEDLAYPEDLKFGKPGTPALRWKMKIGTFSNSRTLTLTLHGVFISPCFDAGNSGSPGIFHA
jgi:hypothetical protein